MCSEPTVFMDPMLLKFGESCSSAQDTALMLHAFALTEHVLCPVVCAVVCHPGAHAGAHVKAQDLQPQPPGLSQDMPVPKMAENGSSTR